MRVRSRSACVFSNNRFVANTASSFCPKKKIIFTQRQHRSASSVLEWPLITTHVRVLNHLTPLTLHGKDQKALAAIIFKGEEA